MYKFPPGSTSVSIYMKMRDSTTGLAKAGLVAGSAGAQCSYTRKGGVATAIALSDLSSQTAPYSAGGFKEIDPTLAKGLYRLDLPDAALAAGVPFVVVALAFTGTVEEAVLVMLETPAQLAGAGAIAWTIQVRNNSTGNPLPGAAVWVTTDQAGSNVVAGTLTTDQFGNVTFYLNAGTYYVWVSDPGYSAPNPTAIVVS